MWSYRHTERESYSRKYKEYVTKLASFHSNQDNPFFIVHIMRERGKRNVKYAVNYQKS